MKTNLSFLARLVVCLLAAGAVAAAQEAASVAKSVVIPQVDFKQTNVRAVVEFLREKTGVNIVMEPEVGDFALPELKLRNVTATAALSALAVASGKSFLVTPWTENEKEVSIYLQLPLTARQKLRNEKPEIVTRAFRLPADAKEQFEDEARKTIEAVTRGIALAADARGEGGFTGPKWESHEPTRLLLVAGTRENVAIASQVIAAIRGEEVTTEAHDVAEPKIKVTILGSVLKPGVYTLEADSSLAPLVGKAGGFTGDANQRKLLVLSKDGSKQTVDFKQDPAGYKLRDGDVVTVPEPLFK